MMKLLHYPHAPYSRKVLLAAYEKDVAFESEIWDQPENDPPFFEVPKAPADECARAIVDAIEGDRFETYAPDMQKFVVGKTSDVDGFLATMVGLTTGSSAG